MKRLALLVCFTILIGYFVLPPKVCAKEKRVITQKEFDNEIDKAIYYGCPGYCPSREDYDTWEEYDRAYDEWSEKVDEYEANIYEYEEKGWKLFYKKVVTYNGAYQENGLKIYTVMNGKTKTIKKTGAFSIIVGGTTVEKNEGTIKFVAPSDGKYKFVLDARNNIASGNEGITIIPSENTTRPFMPRVLYEGTMRNPNTIDIVLSKQGSAQQCNTGGIPYITHYCMSDSKACVGWLRMKKGQYLKLRCRAEHASIEHDFAYDFTGVDITITKE